MGQTEMLVIVLVVVIILLYYMSSKKQDGGACGYPLEQGYYVDEYAPSTGLAVESRCRDSQSSLNDRASLIKRPPPPTKIPIQNTIYWQTDKSEDDTTYDAGSGAINCVSSEKFARGNDIVDGIRIGLNPSKASRSQFNTDRSQ